MLGLLQEAREQGTIVAGGEAVEGEGYFVAPTIVRGLPDDTRMEDFTQIRVVNAALA